MDVIEDAIDDFTYCLEFYEEWRSALMKKKVDVSDLVSSSLDKSFFETTMKRHVGIVKLFAVELYNHFDLYVIEKYKSPFIVKRPGKKVKKLRFGEKKYAIAVDVEPHEIFPLYERLSGESLTKKELEVLNRLYDGTVGVCRLLKFMDERKNDPPAEKGEEILVQMFNNEGEPIQGIVTRSPYATSGSEIDDHLDVISTCKNMSSLEANYLNDVLFGLKFVLAKLKRMKSPYITAVQMATVGPQVPKVPVYVEDELPMEGESVEDPGALDMALDMPPEGVAIAKLRREEGFGEEFEIGGGDAGLSRTWDRASESKHEPFCGPFSKYPETFEIEEDNSNPARSQGKIHGELTEVKITSPSGRARRCTIQ